MILRPGEKIHVIHRRLFERDLRKHFAGVVLFYEAGIIRAEGHVYVIEDPTHNIFKKKPDKRIRIMSVNGGDLLVNVLPQEVDLNAIRYDYKDRGLRITDGSDWCLDIREFGWI